LIRLYAAIRRPSGVRNACERAVPISVPPYYRTIPSARKSGQKKGGPRRTYLSEPAAHIVPSDAHDVAPLERPPAGVIARSITQERTIAKAQVVDECRIADLDVERRLELGRNRSLRFCVPADQAFVSFSNDPSLTPSVGVYF
jgi:hypothetical protein